MNALHVGQIITTPDGYKATIVALPADRVVTVRDVPRSRAHPVGLKSEAFPAAEILVEVAR